jgi:hypothetical protein
VSPRGLASRREGRRTVPEFALRDDVYVLNQCTKYLARDPQPPRHDFLGTFAGQARAAHADCWRFPVVDASSKGPDWNDVTFLYRVPIGAAPPGEVQLVATVERLFERIPLRRLGDTPFFACSLVVPRMRRYRYRFLVDGRAELDEINPQIETLATGDMWSSVFTWSYNQPVTFERWEFVILDRLTRHILPFNTDEAQNYLRRHAADPTAGHLYRLDTSVGVANFIDKVVAREERHRLYAYRTCLEQIDRVLRRRYEGRDPEFVEEAAYVRIYNEMAGAPGALFTDGWDRGLYDSPSHFLWLLRRHAILGAFSHPKYGGNAAGSAWSYLAQRYPFDWQQAIEPPLGTSRDYLG